MIRRLITFLLIAFIWAGGTITVDVDRRKITEGDSITLSVIASNINEDPEVRLPEIEDFKVVSGPSQSSSTNVQFINGKMTKSATLTYSWILIPERTGQVIIPSIKITAGKQSFISSPIVLDVYTASGKTFSKS